MKRERDMNVVRLPIGQINVVNPRTRGKAKFKQIVSNISTLGLKKPITVVRRGTRDGQPQYDLVCGQGRIEALLSLGETEVPALILEATKEELLLMSLAENLARRRHTSTAMLREVANLREKGYTHAQIAEKTDLHETYVKGILRLLKHGEHKLLHEVERGRIPISIAVTIATADEKAVQRAMADAYSGNTLRGKELLRARRLIEQRRAPGERGRDRPRRRSGEVTGDTLTQAFKRETAKQRVLVQKSRTCETRLLFVTSALKQLLADPGFTELLRTTGLDEIPGSLLARVNGKDN